MTMALTAALALIGDSDIRRWPKHLLPKVCGVKDCIVSGHDGATLEQILPRVRDILTTTPTDNPLVVVVCAGENDIGESRELSTTLNSFQELVGIIFSRSVAMTRLIFLGPKIEPWLEHDTDSRKKYIRLSKGIETLCRESSYALNITFLDCLTVFCGETADLPGALYGGRARALPSYFAPDGLHLSDAGYAIWKHLVEETASKLLDA